MTHRLLRNGLLCASLLAGLAGVAHCSEMRVQLHATVLAIQCTPEQRLKIRACAPAQEKYTTEAAKTMMYTTLAAAGEHEVSSRSAPVLRDAERQVMIKTVLY